MKTAALVVAPVLTAFSVFAQHGIDPAWGTPLALPKNNTIARTTVGNTLLVSSQGSIWLFHLEAASDSSAAQLMYNFSTNGLHWTNLPFPPAQAAGSVGGFNAAIDSNDNLHVVWNRGTAQDLHYSRYDRVAGSWTDSVIATAQVARISFPCITVDLSNRVHVFWQDGSGNDSSDAEVFYVSSADNGLSIWEPNRNLSNTPGQASVFARGDFSGAQGDVLAVAWREEVTSNNWDSRMAYSTNGGASWTVVSVAEGAGQQRDPGLSVDRRGVIHYVWETWPALGGSSKKTIHYLQITNAAQLPPMSAAIAISDTNYMSDLLVNAYDGNHDLFWVFWKDGRDYVNTTNANQDVMGRCLNVASGQWGPLEFVSDLGDGELGYKKCALGADGRVHFTFETPPTGSNTIYYTLRHNPVTLGKLAVTGATGDQVALSWTPAPAVRLQSSTNLVSGEWNDVPGTLGGSSAIRTNASANEFFRLSAP